MFPFYCLNPVNQYQVDCGTKNGPLRQTNKNGNKQILWEFLIKKMIDDNSGALGEDERPHEFIKADLTVLIGWIPSRGTPIGRRVFRRFESAISGCLGCWKAHVSGIVS